MPLQVLRVATDTPGQRRRNVACSSQNTGATWTRCPQLAQLHAAVILRTPVERTRQYWIGGNDGVLQDHGQRRYASPSSAASPDVRSLSVDRLARPPRSDMLADRRTPAAIDESVDGRCYVEHAARSFLPGVGELRACAGARRRIAVARDERGHVSPGVRHPAFDRRSRFSNGVVGPAGALGRDGRLYWLLAGGQGLRTSTDNGVTWHRRRRRSDPPNAIGPRQLAPGAVPTVSSKRSAPDAAPDRLVRSVRQTP